METKPHLLCVYLFVIVSVLFVCCNGMELELFARSDCVESADIDIDYAGVGVDIGDIIASDISNGECVQLGPFAATLFCGQYTDETYILLHDTGGFCGGAAFDIVRFRTGLECVAYNFTYVTDTQTFSWLYSFKVTGCNASVSCNTNMTQWSSWSTTCGPAFRSRQIISTLSNGSGLCVSNASQSLYNVSHRLNVCDGVTASVVSEVCSIKDQVCYLVPGNDPPFDTFDGFLSNSPIFTDGWTLLVGEFPRNCTVVNNYHCEPTVFIQAVISTSLSNITIKPLSPLGQIRIRVDVAAALDNTIDDPLCGAFVFSGNNITLQNVSIVIDERCYSMISPVNINMLHGAAIRLTGTDASISGISISNAIVGIAVTPVPAVKSEIGDVGRLAIADLTISNSRAINQFGGLMASCWAINLVADSGIVFLLNISTSCVCSYVPSEKLSIIHVGVLLLDSSVHFVPVLYSDPIAQLGHAPIKPNTLLRFIIYIMSAVVVLMSIVYMYRRLYVSGSEELKKQN
jgi:hypothetical protein